MTTAKTPARRSPEQYQTMAQAAVDQLREWIVSRELEPGAPLRLEELAGMLGMSMSPVRDALQRLESLGLAVHVPRRGTRVAELTARDLRDTYEVRLELESLAIRRASRRFSDEDRVAAEAALREYATAIRRGDTPEARAAHTEFHFTIYEASASDWAVRLIRPAWENAERYRAVSVPTRGGIEERRQEHASILEACARHDPDVAEQLLRDHLTRTVNLVLPRMGSNDRL